MDAYSVRSMLAVALVLLLASWSLAAERASPWDEFVEQAGAMEDPRAARAARFLAEHAPPRDATIDPALLHETLELALRARDEFPWAGAVPEAIFLNDVLPYASLDETRERWRPALYAISRQIVKDATTAGDAAQLLNDHLFDVVGVHYNTGRKRANQSPFESMKQGRATCTGLSILLVNACRSVGIPARVAGVAEWVSTPGNHTWVEVWDGERWRFAGADEHDPRGLDRGWFVGRASEAIAGSEDHAVWASSWRVTGDHFPLAWSREDRTVAAVDVTLRYAPHQPDVPADQELVTRFFRVWDREGGDRVIAALTVCGPDGSERERLLTRAGRADLNDMPSARFEPGSRALLDINTGALAMRTLVDIGTEPTGVVDLFLDALALSREEAESAVRDAVDSMAEDLRTARGAEIASESVTVGARTMRYTVRAFGDREDGRRALWISLHGGGGAPSDVNDRQWRNQIGLYEPSEGVYVAPRAPTDTWNLWHQAHIDPLLDRLIGDMVLTKGVDPDRVYLLGYSAGGDGVYQLAPRMADRFAAASMMAGHPNEARPEGLRNLAFAIFMGGDDAAYNRNTVAKSWGDRLGALHEQDPEGYEHRVTIYPGLGHWMEGRDAEALAWMLGYRRDPWPRRVVWYQDDVVGHRFYWLAVRPGDAAQGQMLGAEVKGQRIAIEAEAGSSPERVTLRLSDALVDLDKPVSITVNGAVVFDGRVARTLGAIEQSLSERFDPRSVATAVIEIALR
jgi:transglutaminase-like putative cysteine protease